MRPVEGGRGEQGVRCAASAWRAGRARTARCTLPRGHLIRSNRVRIFPHDVTRFELFSRRPKLKRMIDVGFHLCFELSEIGENVILPNREGNRLSSARCHP